MSDISNMQPVPEIPSGAKKNPARRQGKASRQKHVDAFREKKGAPELAKIHAAAAKRTFNDLDLEAGLELLAKLHISQSRTEAQIPATTRSAGFIANEVYDEATIVAHRATANSGIDKPTIYRVTLSQIAVQQSIAAKKSSDVQDAEIADHQPEFISQDVSAQVMSTAKSFGVLTHLVNSFGIAKYGARTYRTYIRPHPSVEVGPTGRGTRRALTSTRIRPNPYLVTIQTLRDVVLELADPTTPEDVRRYFRMHNPLPDAVWSEDHLLLNPDVICPVNDYLNSGLFQRDIDCYRRFISAVGGKMRSYLSECTFTGLATTHAMFVSCDPDAHISDGHLFFESETTFRSSIEISDQSFLSGAIALIGENPFNISSFRDPTIQTSRIHLSWRSMIRDLMIKQ